MKLLPEKSILLVLVAMIAFSAGNGNAVEAAPAAVNTRTVLVIGDSLSAAYGMDPARGWVALLEKKLKTRDKRYQVVNGSISGDTTAGGRNRLPRLLKRHRPGIVMIELGANDGLRGLPLVQMKKNLETMIRAAQKAGAKVVVAAVRIPPNYGPKYTREYYNNYVSLAKTHGTVLVPYLLEGVPENPRLMQPDNFHPNEKAQALILNNVWKRLLVIL